MEAIELFGSAINGSWEESIVEKGFSIIPKLMMAVDQVCVNRSWNTSTKAHSSSPVCDGHHHGDRPPETRMGNHL